MKPQKFISSGFQLEERGLVTSCSPCGRANRLTYERLDSEFGCGNCRMSLPAPAGPMDVADSLVFGSLTTRSALPVLVDFSAPWCGPCKVVAPELVKVAPRSAGQCLVVKADTEALPDVVARFGIQSIPTIAVFQLGREIQLQAGAMSAKAILQFMHPAF